MSGSKATVGRVEVKDGDRGEVTAVFSTLNVRDSDGDVTVPGAFQDGAEVIVSSYQHRSWEGVLPVGKGRIRTTATEALLDATFFMNTTHGRDTFEVVKQLGGRQQWSYGFDVLDSDDGVHDGRPVRVLKRLKVHEVSPVLLGAGVNTRTLATKAAAGTSVDDVAREYLRFIKGEFDRQIADELAEVRARLDEHDELRAIARRIRGHRG